MALVYPLTLLDIFPGWSTEFDIARQMEQSRAANGKTFVKDMADPLWRGSWTSKVLSPNLVDEWRARLDALEDGLQTFRAWSSSRLYPIAYPRGSWPTGSAFAGSGTIGAINANRKAITAAGFPSGFQFKVGDHIQIGSTDLHRVMENATTGQFEIRPHLWPGVAAGAALKVFRPSCIMQIVPGSVVSAVAKETGRGTVSFQGMEARG